MYTNVEYFFVFIDVPAVSNLVNVDWIWNVTVYSLGKNYIQRAVDMKIHSNHFIH